MEVNAEKYNKLGNNIKGLRGAFDQSQLELAFNIGVGVTAVSQYENGKRIPERDILIKIAKHFHITVNELLTGDYSRMINFTSLPIMSREYGLAKMDNTLSILSGEDAEKNTHFSEALKIHISIYDLIRQEKDYDSDQIMICLALYEKALKDGIIEAAANMLWWQFLIGMTYVLGTPRFISILERKNPTSKEIFESILYHDEDECDEEFVEHQSEKREYIKESEEDFLVNIVTLKYSKKYMELGDYYLALYYIFSLCNNDKSPEMNRAIGIEMMTLLRMFGNKYAKRFLSTDDGNDT